MTDNFLVECKTSMTEKQSIAIKRDWIDKLEEERFSAGKPYWAIAFDFGGLKNNENFYIINEDLFLRMKTIVDQEEQ